uniref:DNA mismatch repair protein MSH6 n=1 Tax=Tetraselmis sp. GSL018 TaxID=582737 RepID=A0A061SDZ5_9CHLO
MLPVPLEEEAGDDTASEGGDSGSDWEEEELANPPGESEDDGSDLGEEEEEDLDDASEGADELPPPDPRRGGAKRRLGGAPVQRRPAKRAAARPHSPRPAAAASSAAHLEVPTPCPPPGAKESLALALREAPPAAASAPPTGSAPTRELIGEAARFAARDAERFRHLLPDNLRDAGRKRPSDPGYDPRTLFIPPSWFRDWKVSEGQKQWWEFKAANFDSVLLFKMGKFYEMFEMDAHIGAEVLGLSYMKGDQPHCGFPEKNYHQNAELLARSGHRVVVIEQTETPEMLARRNEERQRRGEKKATVVRREKVAVLTRATMMDPEMLASNPEASYLSGVPQPRGGFGPAR